MLLEEPLKVAVVEDNEVELNLHKRRLEKDGRFEVLAFSDPVEAFKIIKEKQIKIVFTDLQMKSLNGEELLGKINGLHHGAQVYIITGSTNYITLSSCLNAGVRNILLKPVSTKDIIACLDDAEAHFAKWKNIILKVIDKKKAS